MVATIEERLQALEREHVEIKLRLSTVEGQFEFISRQMRESHLYMHAKFTEVDAKFAEVRADIKGLRDDLPRIVGDAMREVLLERKG